MPKFQSLIVAAAITSVTLPDSPLAAAEQQAQQAYDLQVMDGAFNGASLQAYDLVWKQCSFSDGKWLAQADLSETLDVLTDDLLRLRQTIVQPDGIRIVNTSYLDRTRMAPRRLVSEVWGPNEEPLVSEHRLLNADGYEGFSVRGDQLQAVDGKISTTMLSGAALGLPLATQKTPSSGIRFAVSMMNFDATYDVIATWVGTDTINFNGQDVRTQMVDIEWHHKESGDVYPAGPDASGGRFWIVQNPPAGFPYVPRYKTDSYAVEFVADTCAAQ